MKTQAFESEIECRARALGSVTFAPEAAIQSPADFDAGREMRFKPGHGQPDKARELRLAGNLHSPESKTALRESGLGPIGGGVAFSS